MPASKKRQSPEPDDIWHQHKAEIKRLYQSEDRTIKEVKEIMERDRGFPKKQLSTWIEKIGKLKIRKNTASKDWQKVWQHIASYRLEDPKRQRGDLKLKRTKKKTEILFHSRRYTWDQAWKNMKSAGTVGQPLRQGPPSPLPAHIVIRTPPPSPSLPSSCALSLHFAASPTFRPPQECMPSSRALMPRPAPEEDVTGLELADRVSRLMLYSTPIWAVVTKLAGLLAVDGPAVPSPHVCQSGSDHLVTLLGRKSTFSQLDNGTTTPEQYPLAHLILSAILEPTSAVIPAMPASGCEAYIQLSMAIYVFSNNLVYVENDSTHGSYSHIFQSLDAIFAAIPQKYLHFLLQSRLASVRAAWEKLLEVAGKAKQPHFFKVLVDVGVNNDWFATCSVYLGNKCLLLAVSMDLVNVVQALLDVGCRPNASFSDVNHIGGDTAITEAFKRGSIRCAELLLQYCDVNRPTERGSESSLPAVAGPSNFDCFVSRARNYADLFEKGLEMFLAAGADIDAPVKWFSDSWMYGNFYELWLSTHQGSWWPSTLDYLFGFHRAMFDRCACWSRAFVLEVTRAGVLSSLENGVQGLRRYLSTRAMKVDPKRLQKFLELIVAEQLVIRDPRKSATTSDLTIIHGLPDYGVSIENVLEYPCSLLDEYVERTQEDCFEDNVEVLSLLVMKGAIVSSDTLAAAVRVQGIRLLEFIVNHTVEVARKGTRALAEAASLYNVEAVDLLLHNGVDINAQLSTTDEYNRWYSTDEPVSVLACAAAGWWWDGDSGAEDPSQIIRLLVERGAHLRLSTTHQDPVQLLEFLLVETLDLRGQDWLATIQYIVRERTHTQTLSLLPASLLEACERIFFPKEDSAGIQIFASLFEHGAALRPGSPLAVWIYMGGGAKLVQDMLDADIDIIEFFCQNSRYGSRRNPLQAAAWRYNDELVSLLLDHGADVNAPAKGWGGRTALQASCDEFDHVTPGNRVQKMKTIQLLLANGADINAPPARYGGLTALQGAARAGNLELVVLLLRHGADVNAPPCRRPLFPGDDMLKHHTALDWAAYFGRIDVVKLLLNANALSHDRGKTGYDGAIKRAETTRKSAVAELIRQHARDAEQYPELTNPHLAQPLRDWREYTYGSDEENLSVLDSSSSSSSDGVLYSDDETNSDYEYGSETDSVEYDVDNGAIMNASAAGFSQNELLTGMSGITAPKTVQRHGWVEGEVEDMEVQPQRVQDVRWSTQMDIDKRMSGEIALEAVQWHGWVEGNVADSEVQLEQVHNVDWDTQMDMDMGVSGDVALDAVQCHGWVEGDADDIEVQPEQMQDVGWGIQMDIDSGLPAHALDLGFSSSL